jgi:hypothetical protein
MKSFPNPEHRSVALSNQANPTGCPHARHPGWVPIRAGAHPRRCLQASMVFIILYFNPEILHNEVTLPSRANPSLAR